jgi:hypothetical protein
VRWAGKKYKRLRSYNRFKAWWSGIIERDPKLFAHWARTRGLAGLCDEKSGVMGAITLRSVGGRG